MTSSIRAPAAGTLRVLTWNIHKGIGGLDRRYALNRTISVLEHYCPDIILLQEVAQGMKKLGNMDQVVEIANALGMHSAFQMEHQFRSGGYGNLVLSRWPIHLSTHLDLTIGWRKRRGMLQATIRSHFGEHQRTVIVHNLHLGLAGTERKRQLERFVRSNPFLAVHRDTPNIIAGDLNDLWGNLGKNHLIPEGFERAGHLVNTFPSALPMRPLDGLFYRGRLAFVHGAVGRTNLAKSASDHLPLYADFELT